MNGASFVYEIEGTTREIFYSYILEFSKYKLMEFKIIVIDNAGFHSLARYKTPNKTKFIKTPPYSPELNHSGKV
ncbi:MAG: transposase [Bacteroidales bacterium]|nr:transposase [Bacteroidales bacterium]